jgi:urease accessory protein UreE
LVLVGATMLQMGYAMGRRHAEAEILEGWMRL